MNFIPEMPNVSKKVPYFEDARAEDGWEGQATGKSIETLQSEVTVSISRLGAIVTAFQPGSFDTEQGSRPGYRIDYFVISPNGQHVNGRIDIAALPLNPRGHQSTKEKRRKSSLKMALFMIRRSFSGMWNMQQLSPGFAALVPFMLGPGGKTVSELWAQGPMSNLLPPGEENFNIENGDIVEGEAKDL